MRTVMLQPYCDDNIGDASSLSSEFAMPLEHSTNTSQADRDGVYFEMKELGSGRPLKCCVRYEAINIIMTGSGRPSTDKLVKRFDLNRAYFERLVSRKYDARRETTIEPADVKL
jgi:hypothetical protein